MSIRIMSIVWDHGPRATAEAMVLLALADYCNDDGECWPSVASIARKARMTERGVQKICGRLCEIGWLQIDRNAAKSGCNLYRITPEPRSPLNHVHPEPSSPNPRTTFTHTPEPRSPEPSITINEPSDNIKRDAVRDELERWASPQAVSSFMAYRKKSKAKALTETAAKRLASSLQQIFDAGGDCDDALGLAEERGWQTVKPDWYFKDKAKDHGNGYSAGKTHANGGRRHDPAIDNILRLAGVDQTQGNAGS